MNRQRILLADDHQIFLEGLKKLLEPDFELVGEVHDGEALVRKAAQLQPDLIVAENVAEVPPGGSVTPDAPQLAGNGESKSTTQLAAVTDVASAATTQKEMKIRWLFDFI